MYNFFLFWGTDVDDIKEISNYRFTHTGFCHQTRPHCIDTGSSVLPIIIVFRIHFSKVLFFSPEVTITVINSVK